MGHEIEGVGSSCPGEIGSWKRGLPAATFLANAAAIHGRRPATLTTTERVGALIRPSCPKGRDRSGSISIEPLGVQSHLPRKRVDGQRRRCAQP